MSELQLIVGRPKSGCSPMPSSVSYDFSLPASPTLRQVKHSPGHHYFVRLEDGTLLCDCGQHLDRYRNILEKGDDQ